MVSAMSGRDLSCEWRSRPDFDLSSPTVSNLIVEPAQYLSMGSKKSRQNSQPRAEPVLRPADLDTLLEGSKKTS